MTPEQLGTLVAAFFRPRNLLLLAGTLAASGVLSFFSLTVGAVTLLGGGGLWGLSVLATWRDPAFARKALEAAEEAAGRGPAALRSREKARMRLGSGLEGTTRQLHDQAQRAATHLRSQLTGVQDPFLSSQLTPLLPKLDQFQERMYRLCRQRQKMLDMTREEESVQAEIERLRAQAEEALEQDLREDLEDAVAAREDQLRGIRGAAETASRIEAEVTRVTARLEASRTDLAHMLARREEGETNLSLGQDLDEMADQIATLEASIEELHLLERDWAEVPKLPGQVRTRE